MNKTFLFFITPWALLFLSNPAHAYLDAGSGSMILQLLLGGVAGLAVIVKVFWSRIKGIFGISGKEKKDGQPDEYLE